MKNGKLPIDLLKSIIIDPVKRKIKRTDEILIGPDIGEDCALLDFGDDNILVSSDPITAADENAGRLLIDVCVNDIAASGGTPVGIMVTMLIPPKTPESALKKLSDELIDEANKHNLAILGGHTEITDSVNKIVLAGTILGRVKKGANVKTSGAKPSDKIVMTKLAGIEGASILISEFEPFIKGKFGDAFIDEIKKLSHDTAVLREAKIAVELGASSMHDITEGGVLGAVYEASEACGLRFDIDLSRVRMTDETVALCELADVSPFELISSGSLLVTTQDGEGLVKTLAENGIKAAIIGEVSDGSSSDSLVTLPDGSKVPLAAPEADAIYTAIENLRAMTGTKPKTKKRTVVFVCTGNTCRSPMAEALAKKIAGEDSGFNFISRGVNAENGCAASKNSILAMKQKGIDISEFTSDGILGKDALNADLILTMTISHKKYILGIFSDVDKISQKVFTLREYALRDIKKSDISDPFGLSMEDYIKCADELEHCMTAAIKRLRKDFGM